jgi:hypothetical protein
VAPAGRKQSAPFRRRRREGRGSTTPARRRAQGSNYSLPPAARDEQVEQNRASSLLVHHDELARQAIAQLSHHRPIRRAKRPALVARRKNDRFIYGQSLSRALFGAGDSQHRLNIDLANVFAAWTDSISSVKRPALGIECTVRSFGTLEALRSFSYLSCHSKVISLTFYDQRVPSWSELKLGVLRTQQ